jgi:hypothetical protein
MPRFCHRCYRSLCDDVETRRLGTKAAEQFNAATTPKPLPRRCLPLGYSISLVARLPVLLASAFRAFVPLTVLPPSEVAPALHRHAPWLKSAVAGSPSPGFALKHQDPRIKSFGTLSACTMHSVDSVTIPSALPLAAGCPTSLPHLLYIAE